MTLLSRDFSGLLYYNPVSHGFNPVVSATLNVDNSTVDEGAAATFHVVAWDVPSNGVLYWRVANRQHLTTNRFSATVSSVSIVNNRGSFNITVSTDATDQTGTQTYDVILSKTPTGTSIATVTVTVSDTSQTPPGYLPGVITAVYTTTNGIVGDENTDCLLNDIPNQIFNPSDPGFFHPVAYGPNVYSAIEGVSFTRYVNDVANAFADENASVVNWVIPESVSLYHYGYFKVPANNAGLSYIFRAVVDDAVAIWINRDVRNNNIYPDIFATFSTTNDDIVPIVYDPNITSSDTDTYIPITIAYANTVDKGELIVEYSTDNGDSWNRVDSNLYYLAADISTDLTNSIPYHYTVAITDDNDTPITSADEGTWNKVRFTLSNGITFPDNFTIKIGGLQQYGYSPTYVDGYVDYDTRVNWSPQNTAYFGPSSPYFNSSQFQTVAEDGDGNWYSEWRFYIQDNTFHDGTSNISFSVPWSNDSVTLTINDVSLPTTTVTALYNPVQEGVANTFTFTSNNPASIRFYWAIDTFVGTNMNSGRMGVLAGSNTWDPVSGGDTGAGITVFDDGLTSPDTQSYTFRVYDDASRTNEVANTVVTVVDPYVVHYPNPGGLNGGLHIREWDATWDQTFAWFGSHSTSFDQTTYGSGNTFGQNGNPYGPVTARLEGYFAPTQAGSYTFTLVSDNSAWVWFGNQVATASMANSNLSTGGITSITVNLVPGDFYPILLIYTQSNTGPDQAGFTLFASGTGITGSTNSWPGDGYGWH